MFKRIARLFRRRPENLYPTMIDVTAEQFAEICRVWDSSRAFRQSAFNLPAPITILRAERMRTEIARLKRNKKRWSHLQRELDQMEGSL